MNERIGITLTESAAKEIRKIIEDQDLSDSSMLRVGVKGGGCSGFSYVLDLTETKKESDIEYDQHGLKVVCDERSLLYLDGVLIDFRDEIMGRGFVFENPKSTGSCGCKQSFSV